MFSINKRNYQINYDSQGKLFICEMNLKNKTIKPIINPLNDAIHKLYLIELGQFYNYVELRDQVDYIAIFDDNYIRIDFDCTREDVVPKNFMFNKDLHQIFFCSAYKNIVSINNVKTGEQIISKTVDHLIFKVQLSPLKNKVLLTINNISLCALCVIDLDAFLNLLLNTNMNIDVLRKYIIVKNEANYQWINDDFIYGYSYQFINNKLLRCDSIYNLKLNTRIQIQPSISRYHLPHLINNTIYLIRKDEIIIITDIVKTITNPHCITHYNKYLDIFISKDYNINKLINNKFVPFNQIYYDYKLAPNNIQEIVNIMHNTDNLFEFLPNEIINIIYIQFLEIDYFPKIF